MIQHDLMFLILLVISLFLPASFQNDCTSYSFITDGLVSPFVNGRYVVTTTEHNGRPVYSKGCGALHIYFMNSTDPPMWILGAEVGSQSGFTFKESLTLDSADPWWFWSIEKDDWQTDKTVQVVCAERECRRIRVRGSIHDVVNADYVSSNTHSSDLMYKHYLSDNVIIKRSQLPQIDGVISVGWTVKQDGELLMFSQYTSCGPIDRNREWLVQKNSVVTVHNDVSIICLDSGGTDKEHSSNHSVPNSVLTNQSTVTSTDQPITTQEISSAQNITNVTLSASSTTTTKKPTTTTTKKPTTSTTTIKPTTTTKKPTTTTKKPTTTTTTTTTKEPTTTTTTTKKPTTTTKKPTTTTITTTPSTTTRKPYDPKDEKFPHELTGCGMRQASAPSLFIVGANDVPYEGKWPWTVAIFDTKRNFICSGALISLDHLITAGHCFAGQKNNSTHYVIVGAYDLSKDAEPNRQISNITRFAVHHNYSRITQGSFRVFNDIAMAVLETPLILTEYVRPICLPKHPPDQVNDCFVAGYGQRGFTGNVGTLQHDQKTGIMNINRCAGLLKEDWMKNTSSFCATPQNHAKICKGDSGSPLMCRFNTTGDAYSIVGLASWSLTICILSDFPSIYINIYDYLTWLNEVW